MERAVFSANRPVESRNSPGSREFPAVGAQGDDYLKMVPMILAYFDPGPGSLLVQAIVAGFAGLAVFGKYLWNSMADKFRPVGKKPDAAEPKTLSAASSGEIPINPQ